MAVRAAAANPAGVVPGGTQQPIQLPALNPQQTRALGQAASTGNVQAFMTMATRAGMSAEQAGEFLRQYVQQHPAAARSPKLRAVANAVNQRIQAERQQQPGSPEQQNPQQPGQQGNANDFFKIPIIGWLAALFAAPFGQGPLAANNQQTPSRQAPQPPPPPQQRAT